MRKKCIKGFCIIICSVLVTMTTYEFINHYEKYDTIAKNQLMLALNNNDAEAILYYKENYTNDNVYLYNGDLSFDLFADNNDFTNLEKCLAYEVYKNSGLSLQKFANKYNK